MQVLTRCAKKLACKYLKAGIRCDEKLCKTASNHHKSHKKIYWNVNEIDKQKQTRSKRWHFSLCVHFCFNSWFPFPTFFTALPNRKLSLEANVIDSAQVHIKTHSTFAFDSTAFREIFLRLFNCVLFQICHTINGF